MVAVDDTLSEIATSNDGWDGAGDDNEHTEQGQLSEDDEPGWVRKLDELTHPGWEDAAAYFTERDKKYGPLELNVPAVVKLWTDDDAAAPPPTTLGQLMEFLDLVPGKSQMPAGTSGPGSCHMRPGSAQPLLKTG